MFRFRKKGAKLDMFYSSIIAFLPLKDVQVIYIGAKNRRRS